MGLLSGSKAIARKIDSFNRVTEFLEDAVWIVGSAQNPQSWETPCADTSSEDVVCGVDARCVAGYVPVKLSNSVASQIRHQPQRETVVLRHGGRKGLDEGEVDEVSKVREDAGESSQ